MWQSVHKQSWPKKWCFWIVVIEKNLSPLDCKEFSPGCSLEGLMLKLKLPILWPPDAKSWLIWKDPDAGKDWGQEEKGATEEEKGATEEETVGWHHRLIDMSLGRLRELVMEREALQAAVHGVTKSGTWLSDWTKLLDHCKSKRVPENYLLLLYWLCQSLWLCGSQQSQENSSRVGNTRPPDLPLEKSVYRSGSNS